LKYDKQTDDQLLDLFRRSRDGDALGHLFLRYMELVYGVCLKYLRQPEAAQDAVMDIYEQLQRKLPHQEVSHFPGWLYRVSVNHCLQILRKRSAGNTVPIDDVLVQNTPLLHQDGGFTDLDVEPDQADQLRDCLAGLPEGQRICIKMFYFEKTPYADISERTGMPLDTVRSHIQNGRRNLKKCMDNTTRRDR
jgi:RNA polymerase sigma-70 factor (ECF subfamily)